MPGACGGSLRLLPLQDIPGTYHAAFKAEYRPLNRSTLQLAADVFVTIFILAKDCVYGMLLYSVKKTQHGEDISAEQRAGLE